MRYPTGKSCLLLISEKEKETIELRYLISANGVGWADTTDTDKLSSEGREGYKRLRCCLTFCRGKNKENIAFFGVID